VLSADTGKTFKRPISLVNSPAPAPLRTGPVFRAEDSANLA